MNYFILTKKKKKIKPPFLLKNTLTSGNKFGKIQRISKDQQYFFIQDFVSDKIYLRDEGKGKD